MHYFLDISDVIEFFRHHLSASGIQRVQLEFIRHFSAKECGDVSFVFESSGQGFKTVDKRHAVSLVEALDSGGAKRPGLDKILALMRSSGTSVNPQPGDLFFVSGAFWVSPSTRNSLWNAKKAGARVGFLCFDLIPIRNREFFEKALVDAFTDALECICDVSDFIFTISEYVKRDVESYLRERNISLPVIALPLAHELQRHPTKRRLRPEVANLLDRRFVLFVSTIEARKNHAYTFSLWQQLLARLPADDVPDLVWVGRPGWLVNDLMARVERLDRLDGKLHILNELDDAEVAALYQACWFTIYPSFAEGWGLPVAESLMFGRPAIAANVTSIPEVGNDFVWYIDPMNVTQGVDLVEHLIKEPDKVEVASERIRTSFEPRSWKTVADNLISGFKSLTGRELAHAFVEFRFEPGRFYPLNGQMPAGGSFLSVHERLALQVEIDDGWYAMEHWGRWLKGTSSEIKIKRDSDAPGGRHFVALSMQRAPHWRGNTILLSCPETKSTLAIDAVGGERFDVVGEFDVPSGDFTLKISVDRADLIPDRDRRPLSVGMRGVGYAPANEVEARAAIMANIGLDASIILARPSSNRVGEFFAAEKRTKVRNRIRLFAFYGLRARGEGLRSTMRRVNRRLRMIFS